MNFRNSVFQHTHATYIHSNEETATEGGARIESLFTGKTNKYVYLNHTALSRIQT